jgi:hypothetical protein
MMIGSSTIQNPSKCQQRQCLQKNQTTITDQFLNYVYEDKSIQLRQFFACIFIEQLVHEQYSVHIPLLSRQLQFVF